MGCLQCLQTTKAQTRLRILKWVFSLVVAKKVNMIMNHKLFVANNSMRTKSQYKYHRTKSNLQSMNKYIKQNASFD